LCLVTPTTDHWKHNPKAMVVRSKKNFHSD